jgi:hypothetical protein
MSDALLFIAILLVACVLANKVIKAPGCSGNCTQGDGKCNCNREKK